MIRLFNKFPRQLGLPSRRDVSSLEELLSLIKYFNGKTRIFCSVYNYSESNRDYKKIDVDKLFFDFDSDKCFENVKKFHYWLVKEGYKHIIFFSGKGMHVYVLTKNFEGLKNKKDALYNTQMFFIKKLNFTVGIKKTDDVDSKPIGDLARVATVPNTINTKHTELLENKKHIFTYCICVREEDLEKNYLFIKEKATHNENISLNYKTPPLRFYGNKLFDISKFDSERPQLSFPEELIDDLNLKIEKDKFLKTIPPCVAYWLSMKHIGWKKRGYLISYLRDSGHLLGETIQVLKAYMKDKSEFIHCTTKKVAPGYKEPGEEQPQYLYREYIRSRFSFPSCKTIKKLGDCPLFGEKKCDKWRLYK